MKSNAIGNWLKVIGVIVIVGGVVVGIALATIGEGFGMLAMIICWVGSVIGGLVLMGFGEIVELLQGIYSASIGVTLSDIEDNTDEIAEVDISKMNEKEYATYMEKFDVPEDIK